jgi:hypothetical protein
MIMEPTRRASVGLLFGVLATPAVAHVRAPIPGGTPDSDFARDRQAILGMVGDFKVRFDIRETVSFLAEYTLLQPKVLGGHESVRVIVDTGDVIYLQHLLVAGADGKTTVVKHWRQDWTYQPHQMLTYARLNTWQLHRLPPRRTPGRGRKPYGRPTTRRATAASAAGSMIWVSRAG